MRNYLTVVFKISDPSKFKDMTHKFITSMAENSDLDGAVVTGASWSDVMTEADNMRNWLNQNGQDADAIERGDY